MQLKNILRLVLVFMITLLISGLVYAQEENLLANPGFEDGFDGSSVATGWESWVSDDSDAPSFQEAPTYLAGSTAADENLIPQIRSGSDAQALLSFFATHDAGVYQQVDGITEGTELRFSIYAHVFSNSLGDVDQSENPGGVTVRVGIDPNGGTDPFSDDVLYTEPFITYDTFVQYSIIATASSDTVTVFVRSTVTEPVANSIVFLDDAVLNVTPESTVPTEEATEETPEPTETEEIKDPTPTREVETEETPTEETATAEPTEETPTQETPTDDPETEEAPTEETATAEPTEETPISDEFPGQIIHTVLSGDTVGRLAVRYGSSTQAIIAANGLNESALIFVGQGLIVPVRIVPATETPSATPVVVVVTTTQGTETDDNPEATTYVVQAGDSLSSIARRFNTTVGALIQLNGIANPNRILVGQTLTLPGTGGSVEPTPTEAPATEEPVETEETPIATEEATEDGGDDSTATTYVVQPGDNLYRIALGNGVSLTELAEANNITNFNLIFVGQVLTIP